MTPQASKKQENHHPNCTINNPKQNTVAKIKNH